MPPAEERRAPGPAARMPSGSRPAVRSLPVVYHLRMAPGSLSGLFIRSPLRRAGVRGRDRLRHAVLGKAAMLAAAALAAGAACGGDQPDPAAQPETAASAAGLPEIPGPGLCGQAVGAITSDGRLMSDSETIIAVCGYPPVVEMTTLCASFTMVHDRLAAADAAHAAQPNDAARFEHLAQGWRPLAEMCAGWTALADAASDGRPPPADPDPATGGQAERRTGEGDNQTVDEPDLSAACSLAIEADLTSWNIDLPDEPREPLIRQSEIDCTETELTDWLIAWANDQANSEPLLCAWLDEWDSGNSDASTDDGLDAVYRQALDHLTENGQICLR